MESEVNDWIVSQRSQRNLSQYKLAKLLKVANTKLSSWEMKKSSPSEKEVELLKKCFQGFDSKLKSGKITLKKIIKGEQQNQTCQIT